MITLKLKLGNQTISGPTFSVISNQADEVISYISCLNSTNNQLAHITEKFNGSDKNVLFSLTTTDTSVAQTISVILQADQNDDVDNLLGKYMGIKSTILELIP